jgi:hypothetical protein
MTTNNTNLDKSAKAAPERKRTRLRDARSHKGPMYLEPDLVPGYRLYWAGISAQNPYRLAHLFELGWGPLSDSQMKTVLAKIPDGLVGQSNTNMGSFITKVSGGVTHYLVCTTLENAAELAEEKIELQKERDRVRASDPKNGVSLTSSSVAGIGAPVKVWGPNHN